MKTITLEELLEAGAHFGHQVTRQNPKARGFVFEARDGVHIIDLAMTKAGLEAAAAFLEDLASKNGTLLVVGSKRQAVPVLTAHLEKINEELTAKGVPSNLFSVTARWIGGTLTNREEVTKNYKKLQELTEKLADEFARTKYTKKEMVLMERERAKLYMLYAGVSGMHVRPDAIFIIDTHFEDLAVREAKRSGVPIVGIVDTNADPEGIEYVIPANDDAAGSLELIIGYIMDAWKSGRLSEGKGDHKSHESSTNSANEEVQESKEKKTTKTVIKKESKTKVTKKPASEPAEK